MRILLISDTHQEFERSLPIHIPEKLAYDCIVAVGDISDHSRVISVLKSISDDKPIVYLPGNHEYYHHSFVDVNKYLEDEFEKHSNLYVIGHNFSNGGIVSVDDVVFIGDTFWPKPISIQGFDQWKFAINDFSLISDATMDNISKLHENGKKVFESDIAADKDTTVIALSHFIPKIELISPPFQGSSLNSYFCVDINDKVVVDPAIKFWLFGHTHDKMEKKIDNTMFISNPTGYPGENKQMFCVIDTDSGDIEWS